MSLLTRIKTNGLGDAFRAVIEHATTRRLACYPMIVPLVRDGVGLEIGGPSFVFHDHGMLPLYRHATRVDNCNFSEHSQTNGHVPHGKHSNTIESVSWVLPLSVKLRSLLPFLTHLTTSSWRRTASSIARTRSKRSASGVVSRAPTRLASLFSLTTNIRLTTAGS